MRAAGGPGPGEGQWRGPKAMAVGHGTASDDRKSEARQAARDDRKAGRLPCDSDYVSGDSRGFS